MGKSKFVSKENEGLTRGPKMRFKKTERHIVKKQIHEAEDYEDLDDNFERFERVKKVGFAKC